MYAVTRAVWQGGGRAGRFRRMRLTPEGCRAGRALLKWSTRDLARRAGVAFTTVNRIEAGQLPRASTKGRLLAAFASAGVTILTGPEGVGAVLATEIAFEEWS
jgi:transcriptional regulator with XRE-family HTH domain